VVHDKHSNEIQCIHFLGILQVLRSTAKNLWAVFSRLRYACMTRHSMAMCFIDQSWPLEYGSEVKADSPLHAVLKLSKLMADNIVDGRLRLPASHRRKTPLSAQRCTISMPIADVGRNTSSTSYLHLSTCVLGTPITCHALSSLPAVCCKSNVFLGPKWIPSSIYHG
jgi:hypothetical protein